MINKICMGAGLVSLDVLMRGDDDRNVTYSVGGTCGNVMMILQYMGWISYPIARLDGTHYSSMVINEMKKNHVNTNFIEKDGQTPVIIQINIIDKYGHPSHKFVIKDKKGRFSLGFKSIKKKKKETIMSKLDFEPSLFFYDRISPAILNLASELRERGVMIFFEPSVKPSAKGFERAMELSHVVKFANQRIENTDFTDKYTDKLFIQTLGSEGLRFKYKEGWELLKPVENTHVVDTSGAGDWTSAAFINYMHLNTIGFEHWDRQMIRNGLSYAQKIASLSCSYEGARGLMSQSYKSVIEKLNLKNE